MKTDTMPRATSTSDENFKDIPQLNQNCNVICYRLLFFLFSIMMNPATPDGVSCAAD